MSQDNPFDYVPGSFYTSDDKNTLIHLYYNAVQNKSLLQKVTVHYPLAIVDDTRLIEGTSVEIDYAFATLSHQGNDEGVESTLFIEKLKATVVDMAMPEPIAPDAQVFMIRLKDKNGTAIKPDHWILYTKSKMNQTQPETGEDTPPSLTTKKSEDHVGANSVYQFGSAEKGLSPRDTLYLYDLDSNCYKLSVSDLITIENGHHTE